MSTNDLHDKKPLDEQNSADLETTDSTDTIQPQALPGWTGRISLEEVRAIYVKKGYHRFAPLFARCDAVGGLQPSLVIAPFFIGYLWFFYRKMYFEGLLFMGCAFLTVILISVLVQSSETAQVAGMGANIGLLLIMMIYGKALYWRAVDRKIDKAMHMFPSDPQRALGWLEYAGGTNIWIVLAFIGIIFLFVMVAFNSLTMSGHI